MAFNKTLIIVLLVSLSSLVLHTHAAAAVATSTEDRVTRICSTATNTTLCYQTVLAGVAHEPRFTVYKVVEIEILETQKQAETTLKVIKSLMAKAGKSKDTKDSLSICKDQYESILDSIEKSMKLVVQRDVVEARYQFSGVISYHSSCNDQFMDAATSPIEQEAKVVSDLGSNCLDLLAAIGDRESRRRGGKTVVTPSTGPSIPVTPCKNTVGTCS